MLATPSIYWLFSDVPNMLVDLKKELRRFSRDFRDLRKGTEWIKGVEGEGHKNNSRIKRMLVMYVLCVRD